MLAKTGAIQGLNNGPRTHQSSDPNMGDEALEAVETALMLAATENLFCYLCNQQGRIVNNCQQRESNANSNRVGGKETKADTATHHALEHTHLAHSQTPTSNAKDEAPFLTDPISRRAPSFAPLSPYQTLMHPPCPTALRPLFSHNIPKLLPACPTILDNILQPPTSPATRLSQLPNTL